MNILDNELVKKYFYDENKLQARTYMAYLIVEGMQQVINKGERCLMIGQNGAVTETVWMGDPLLGIRSNAIRLPDPFQKKEFCEYCGERTTFPNENYHKACEPVQKRECESAKQVHFCDCEFCGHPDTKFLRETKVGELQREAVEEKIEDIRRKWCGYGQPPIENGFQLAAELRELVAVARRGK